MLSNLSPWVPMTALFIIMTIFWIFRDRSDNKKREQEQRKRQKLLDQQNNIGRRIFNALEKQVKKITFTRHRGKLTIVSWLSEDSIANDGFGIAISHEIHPITANVPVLIVKVDMFGGGANQFNRPISVEGRQRFIELWGNDEFEIEALINSLQRSINDRYGYSHTGLAKVE